MNRHVVSAGQDAPYRAVIADMDSVLTRMTCLHERAWQQTLNDFLRSRNRQLGEQHAEFAHSEYRRRLDGKLRCQGAADFLAARHIELPFGRPDDAPGTATVCGIGNRKEEILIGLLESEGVAVYEDALMSLRRWRKGGLKLAAISASCNCRNMLRLIELENHLDVIVDGELAREFGLQNKAELMLEAARQLDVDPAESLVLEDTTAGVRAGKKSGFGLVIGVNRNHHAAELENAGADAVARSLAALRFPRRLPSALEDLQRLVTSRPELPMALFLDFDGTLTSMPEDPRQVSVSEGIVDSIRKLSRGCTLGVISGRDREDLQSRLQVEGILYAGSHGLDIAGPGYQKIRPDAEAAIPEVEEAEIRLREALEGISGVFVERKRFAVAVHFRRVRSDVGIQQVKRVVDAVLADTGLRKRQGTQVLELEPNVQWDKGNAVEWLMETTEVDPEQALVIYIGDDETDEDVFAALAGRAIGIRVSGEVVPSLADYHLAGLDEVEKFLQGFKKRCQ